MKTDRKEGRKKRPYKRPKVERYGDVRALTRAVGNKGTDDGGMGGAQKTSA